MSLQLTKSATDPVTGDGPYNNFYQKPIKLFSEPPFDNPRLYQNSCGIVTSNRDILLVQDYAVLWGSPYFRELFQTPYSGIWEAGLETEIAYEVEINYQTTFPFWEVKEDTITFKPFLLLVSGGPSLASINMESKLIGLSMMMKYGMHVAPSPLFQGRITDLVNSRSHSLADKVAIYTFIRQHANDLKSIPAWKVLKLNSAKNLLLTIPSNEVHLLAPFDGLPKNLVKKIQDLHHNIVVDYNPSLLFDQQWYTCDIDDEEDDQTRHYLSFEDHAGVYEHLKSKNKLLHALRYGVQDQEIIEALGGKVICAGCNDRNCEKMIEAFRREMQQELKDIEKKEVEHKCKWM